MKVFKFGGASIKDANGLKNLSQVLKKVGYEDVVLVVSAMGKMTNAFEKICNSYFYKRDDLNENIQKVIDFHNAILVDLFDDSNIIFTDVDSVFIDLNKFIKQNQSQDFNFVYDQIVSRAEIISSKICSCYLLEKGIENTWLDVRKCVKTDSSYRRAKVNWETTCKEINNQNLNKHLTITQGFIASDENGNTTTLGREGSDYTAGIFAYCLDSNEVIIFKDVPGVLNADPREFKKTQLLNQVSYKEAIEMAFYGASVIHPKTLQPLQRKNIPLYVRSFVNPLLNGTTVCKGVALNPKTPCFIVKKNQILLSISDKEFAFVMEDDISEIFDYLHQFRMKVNLIQNSAISFSVCVEDNFNNFQKLFDALKSKYKLLYNENLTLYTIRHFTQQSIKEIEGNKEVFLKQLSRETAQIVTGN